MTDDEAKALGQRALAAGMKWGQDDPGWPDFRDPAAQGVLLAQVRDALRCPWLYVTPTGGRRQSDGALLWEWHGMAYGKSAKGWGWPSEAEALVAALEAAP